MITLRDYQIKMLNGAVDALNNGLNPFVVSPTGSGKMVVIVTLAKHLNLRVLIIEHRIELVKQAIDKLKEINEDYGIILSGVSDPNPNAMIKVGMIQTINRRTGFDGWWPDIVIIDEAHLAAANSYKKLLGKLESSPRICFSATPWRLDGKGFLDICDTIVLGPTIKELVSRGYLVPTNYLAYDAVDLAGCKMSGNEYDQDDVAVIMDDITEEIVATWRDTAGGRNTIVFASNNKHSKNLCRAFREIGVKAEHIDNSTPDAVRNAIVKRVRSGETQVLCNCGIVIEGFDAPIVSCVVLAIATKSLSKFLQCCGRAMRIHPESGKTDMVVMDFGNCYMNHGTPEDDRTWSIEERNVKTGKSEVIEAYGEEVQKAPLSVITYQPNQYDYGGNEIATDDLRRKYRSEGGGASRSSSSGISGTSRAVRTPGSRNPPIWLPAAWHDYWYQLETYRIGLNLHPSYSEDTAKAEIRKRMRIV